MHMRTTPRSNYALYANVAKRCNAICHRIIMTVIIIRCRWADGPCWFFPSSLCSFILNGKSLFSRLIWRGEITLWRNYIIESEINNKWIIGWKVTMPKVNITNTRTQTHSNKTVWDFFGIYHVTQCVLLLLPLLLLAKHVYTWIDGVLIFRSWEYLSRLKPNCVMILAYKHEMDWLLYYQYWRQTTTIR